MGWFPPWVIFTEVTWLSLIQEAHKYSQLIVVSIYVNPGQFSPSEDLSTYPSDFHGDILKFKSVLCGVDAVFCPKNLYDYNNNEKQKNKNENCAAGDGAGDGFLCGGKLEWA